MAYRRPTHLLSCIHLLRGHDRCLLLFNAPVNEALNGWTAATLPTNWSTYRLRWEIGHAFAAVLAVIALVALMRQWKREPTK